VGAKLDALVLQATSRGSAEIDTAFGKLILATRFPLPAQANLQLQLIGKGTALQLLITAVQGKSPQALLRPAVTDPTATKTAAPTAAAVNAHMSPVAVAITLPEEKATPTRRRPRPIAPAHTST